MTEQEARALIADLTTEEKRLLYEFILSMRSSSTKSLEKISREKGGAFMRISEIIDGVDTPIDAIERIGCLLGSIRYSMESLDRAYFSQALPDMSIWLELCGSFHSLQMSMTLVLMVTDELVDIFLKK